MLASDAVVCFLRFMSIHGMRRAAILALVAWPVAATAQDAPRRAAPETSRVGIATGPSFGDVGYRLWNVQGHVAISRSVLVTGRFATGSRLILPCFGNLENEPECEERAASTMGTGGLQLVFGGDRFEPYLGAAVGAASYEHPDDPEVRIVWIAEGGLRFRVTRNFGGYAEASVLSYRFGLLGVGAFFRSR
jgi:hypothetical protein